MQTHTVTIEVPVPTVSIRTLWAVLIALTIGDALTTIVALSVGLPEANPLIHAAIETVGFGGVLLSQVLYIALAWALLQIVDYGHKWVLVAGIVPSALVVVNNAAAIAILGVV
ncbi:DUF5658 family protein [Halosolutus gelatinilyticus]|uniref:DUF5658 family protein n=1 Tax=Halosolutus gelatinilyticus TaxID=2931975 RepID=UPI001FF6CF39|nr:DUF5658 family protein [Halosolutus gelatinilyticus]